MGESRFDEAVATAWGAFEERLRAALASLGEGSMVIRVAAETSGEGCAPYLQFLGDDEAVRGEVSSNAFLDPVCLLAPVQEQALTALGWESPDDANPNWFLDVDRDELGVLVSSALGALRRVLGVLHPDLLSWRETGELPPLSLDLEPEPESPAGVEELRTQVEGALAEHLGEDELVKDDDGDIPIRARKVPLWVRVLEDGPTVHVFSLVVVDVASRRQARIEADILNRHHRYLKFFVQDRQLMAVVDVPATPFAAQHLSEMLDHADEVLNDVVDDLVLRTGGRPFFADGPSRPRRSA